MKTYLYILKQKNKLFIIDMKTWSKYEVLVTTNILHYGKFMQHKYVKTSIIAYNHLSK